MSGSLETWSSLVETIPVFPSHFCYIIFRSDINNVWDQPRTHLSVRLSVITECFYQYSIIILDHKVSRDLFLWRLDYIQVTDCTLNQVIIVIMKPTLYVICHRCIRSLVQVKNWTHTQTDDGSIQVGSKDSSR